MSTKRVTHVLNQSPLYRMRNHRKLAVLLRISPPELRKLSHSDSAYKEFDIAKKAGGTRRVENPARPLKLVQARLARILGRITPPEYLFCPVRGRSYVSNAARHRHNRIVRCIDIRKYFLNTLARRVFWFFKTIMLYETDVAETLTKLATYKEHLPTGSPLSPIMAYFAHYDVWQRIAVIANSNGLVLSVYIDDVTLSGKNVPTRVLWEIKKQIHASGLRYHKEKHFIDGPVEVTGVIIRNGKLFAPNRQLKKLHQSKREVSFAGPRSKQMVADRIKGLIGQLKQIQTFPNADELASE
jgi:retron-type reverse transcriptase